MVRIVCISDTHNQTPPLPAGDVLIHAGDLTRQGTPSELRRAFYWLECADFKAKIVIAGNHDLGLDAHFQQQGKHPQNREQIKASLELFSSSPNLYYLRHESKTIKIPNDDGTEVRFKVFGSPFSLKHGKSAFQYGPSDALELWQDIPLNADVVVTHTPARYHLDESTHKGAAGCEGLRQTLWRIRPKLFVCGHIHEARGVELVEWDLDTPNVNFKERSVARAEERRVGTHFSIDLSSRAQKPLENDGSRGDVVPLSPWHRSKGMEAKKHAKRGHLGLDLDIGRGGLDSDSRTDQEALAGRRGRRQTCIINASYMATNGPCRRRDGNHPVNKAIVIDLDFPCNDGQDEQYDSSVTGQVRAEEVSAGPGQHPIVQEYSFIQAEQLQLH